MGIFNSKPSRSQDANARGKSKAEENSGTQIADPLVRAYYQPQHGGYYSSNGGYYDSSSRGGQFGANGSHYQKARPTPEPAGDYFSYDHHQMKPIGHHLAGAWAAELNKPPPPPEEKKRKK